MASTSNPTAVDSAVAQLNDEQSRLIAERLRQTRRYVKLIDLCTGAVTLVGGILGYLLIVALIDHWLIDLSPAMRLVLLLGLLVGAAGFFVWRLLPPLVYAVNPVYAAQAIEQAAPALKNSLINLVLLARQRNGVAPVIYEGLRRETAGQLARVPPETMVDRAPLIRAGYGLLVLVAMAAAYLVLSPKDPVQSVARLAAPWSDIERPARVKILEVQPGNSSVYRGQTLDVTARIEGLKEDEPVTIFYSSEDEQFIDQPISMRSDGVQRFLGTLSTGPRGIQQTLRYRIAAGDAQSREFVLQVKHAPHIEVRRTVYQFPRYTQLPDRAIEGQGELSALEGTRVQIEAEANQPLASAQLELFADVSAADAPDAKPTRAIPMKTEGNRAVGQLTLLLQPDRRTPQAAAYQIRLTTPDGARNVHPARYRIDVTPDLPPDVEWLQPRAADMELPENGSATLEVRAFDPDFAVEQIRVEGAVGGANRLSEELVEQPQSGQVVRKFQLVPQRLGLQAGDTLIYWAEARDNRQSPAGTPASNVQRTSNRRMRIVAPVAGQQPESGQDRQQGADENQAAGERGSESDQQGGAEGDEGGEGNEGEVGGGEKQGRQGDRREGQDPTGSDGEGEGADRTETAGGRTDNRRAAEGGDAASDASEDGEAEGSKRQTGSRDGRGRTGEDPPAQGSDDGEPQSDAGEPAGDAGERAPGGGRPGDGQAKGTADGTADGEAGSQRDQRQPSEAVGETTRERGDGEPGAGEENSSVDESQPVAPDGSNDSEAFERILRHLREQRERASESRDGGESQTPRDDSPPSAGDPGADTQSPDRPAQDAASERTGGGPRDRGERARRDAENDPDRANDAADPGSEQGERRTSGQDAARDERTDGDGRTSEPTDRRSPGGESTRPDQAGSDQAGSRSDQSRSDQSGGGEPPRGDEPPSVDPTAGRAGQGSEGSDAAQDVPQSADRSDPSAAGESQSGDSSNSPPAAPSHSGDGRPAGEGPDGQPARSGEPASEGAGQTTRTPGGGQAGGTAAEGAAEGGEASAADEANLEYARRATDLALRHLKDDQHSAELRERLGWSREEVAAFLRRWEQMQREARQSGPQAEPARRRLSDQLRGLGLQPQAERVRGSRMQKDDLRSLRQSSNVPIPAEYLEQYRAFLKSAPSQESSRSAAPQK